MIKMIKSVILAGLLATGVSTATASATDREFRSWIYTHDPGSNYNWDIKTTAANSTGQVALISRIFKRNSERNETNLSLIDASGQASWTTALNFNEFSEGTGAANSLAIDPQGNVYVLAAGRLDSKDALSIKKYTADGQHQFSTIIVKSSEQSQSEISPLSIAAGKDGAIYALWYSSAFGRVSHPNVYLGRININTGVLEWNQLIDENDTNMLSPFFMLQIDDMQRPHLVYKHEKDGFGDWTVKHVVLDANGQGLPQVTTMPRSTIDVSAKVTPIAATIIGDDKLNIAYHIRRPTGSPDEPINDSIELEQYDTSGNWQWGQKIVTAPQGYEILFQTGSRYGNNRNYGSSQIPRGKNGSMAFLYALYKESSWEKLDIILLRVNENGLRMKESSISKPAYNTPSSVLSHNFGLFSSNDVSDSVYVAAHSRFNANDPKVREQGFIWQSENSQ